MTQHRSKYVDMWTVVTIDMTCRRRPLQELKKEYEETVRILLEAGANI